MPPQKQIRVLIVDDSASVRQTMLSILESDPSIEVMGTASDPYVAVEKIQKEVPDVITLDIEMPRMDGLTFLERIMSQHPIPVVICSSLTETGSATALAALERGALEIITKPKLGTKQFLEESKILICDAVKSAARAGKPKKMDPPRSQAVQPKLTADAVMAPRRSSQAMLKTTEKIVSVGASTGGTEALRTYLEALPRDAPGHVIVQHMPEKFTASFAKRLDQSCEVSVKEAENGDTVLRGHVLIAPGNKHMLLKRSGARYYVEIKDGPLVCRHRPSVDVLFRSASRYAGPNAIGIIMTGMGDDGAKGMLELKEAGAYNIAQSEASCVVFGMPKEAIAKGAVHKVAHLHRLAHEVIEAAS
ncbi:protein-glutamate methylesterase/protein-glutamine glutaminase [Pelagicoccus mobilis]|uniref:Protein-glutamate methylesterase/protein-glutamine glutaminase n=1 Tax=Pelagicoccus mobilis TaxID=415221 RepID=A0A934VRC5_9BACT|nr:chemotaxis response regulator protein-glutamate methylesterase [Pelagicoccus mobilis]MBK1877478.1 chemotaxis response regulator protein-glutamate methylesterase [Pelagicoccus mobilis]